MLYRTPDDEGTILSAPSPSMEALERALGIELLAAAVGAPVSGPLRDAICGYVLRLRDSGAPPEQVVVAFKRLVGRIRPDDRTASRDLLEALVTACIEVYFGKA